MDGFRSFGEHHLIELWGCDPETIATVEAVRPAMVRAVRDCGATAIRYVFHQFEPEGVTALALLVESHFALHTWPERGYAGADVFTCGTTMDPAVAVQVLREAFSAEHCEVNVRPRGHAR